jgi:guanine deaminase
MTNQQLHFMREAIEEGRKGMLAGEGGPFGAVIVKNGQIIGRGHNQVFALQDPTAHAEVQAIRNACKNLGDFQLTDCELYSSCEPCPMCLGAIYWARPAKLFFACSREDAAAANFDDEFIYQELAQPLNQRKIPTEILLRDEALELFNIWKKKSDKTQY